MSNSNFSNNSNYLWRKSYFRNLWLGNLPLAKKFALSESLFRGREAFIVAGGPSLNQVDIDALRSRLSNSFVITIKQSIEIIGSDSDALIMNFCNFSAYDWEHIECPTLWATFHKSHPDLICSKGAKRNAVFKVIENSTNDAAGFAKSTAGRQHWDNFYRILDGNVCWGPGLMYELAIPLALHVGVSHIYLVAWDIGTVNLTTSASAGFDNEHFYNNSQIEMKTQINNLEIELVARSTKDLQYWLKSRGVGLSVVSDRSLVDKAIAREMQWIKK